MPKASFQLSDDYLDEAQDRCNLYRYGRYLGIVIRLVGLTIFVPLTVFACFKGIWDLAAVCGSISIIMVFANRICRWLMRQSREVTQRNQHVTMTFSNEGCHTKTETIETRVSWGVFQRVVHFKDGFLIFHGPGMAVWIPTTSLERPSMVIELAELLRNNVPQQYTVR